MYVLMRVLWHQDNNNIHQQRHTSLPKSTFFLSFLLYLKCVFFVLSFHLCPCWWRIKHKSLKHNWACSSKILILVLTWSRQPRHSTYGKTTDPFRHCKSETSTGNTPTVTQWVCYFKCRGCLTLLYQQENKTLELELGFAMQCTNNHLIVRVFPFFSCSRDLVIAT